MTPFWIVLMLSIVSFNAHARFNLLIKPPGNGLKHDILFTENSHRRNPSQDELRPILEVAGCAGFFVANTENKLYVGTARHCVRYQMDSACQKKEVTIIAKALPTKILPCQRVVASSPQDDFVVIEVGTEEDAVELRSKIAYLNLIDFLPARYTRFQTLGFPADSHRKGALTLTEKCWDTSGISYDKEGNSTAAIGGNASNKFPGLENYVKALNRTLRWHNCSTWGGNSGGPMLIEGTRQVAGLPTSYYSDDPIEKGLYPYNIAAFYETTAGFVHRNRLALENAGILIESVPSYDIKEHRRLCKQQSSEMKPYKPAFRPRAL